MGSRERRERHRARVRRAILGAARELSVSDGVDQVSLRRIAERLEYSAAALYTYFRSKDDLFLALAEEDAAALRQQLSEVTGQIADPLTRVRRALWVLYEFLKVNPLLLRQLIGDRVPRRLTPGRQRLASPDAIATDLEADVYACLGRGEISADRPAAATRQLLAAGMIGVASVASRLSSDDRGDVLARDVIETLLAGLATAGAGRKG